MTTQANDTIRVSDLRSPEAAALEAFTAARDAGVKALAGLAQATPPQRRISCALCWQSEGRPCTVSGPPGDHLIRYVNAVKLGLLSKAELAAAIGGVEVLADHVILLERRAACWYCDRTGLPLEAGQPADRRQRQRVDPVLPQGDGPGRKRHDPRHQRL
jgi:hypothetical protein